MAKGKEQSISSRQDAFRHNRDLLLALSRAAQAIQRETEAEKIFQVVGEQIKALKCEVTILMLDQNQQQLCYTYTTLSQDVIRMAEKMVGLTAEGHCWSISPDSIYSRIIAQGRGEYVSDTQSLFEETIPVPLHTLTRVLMSVLRIEHGIIAPLIVDEETLGVLVVFGNEDINVDDLPAVDSFASQIAISLRNVRLAKRVALELAERQQAEEEVRRTERHFKALIENATDGILVVKTDATIYYESPAVSRLLGYEPGTLIGWNAFELLHPDDLPAITTAFIKGLETPSFIHHGEYRLRHASGEWRYFEIVSHYLLNDPVIEGIIINGRDITERKQAERLLAASEAELRALFASMQDTVLVIDREGFYRKVAPTHPGKFYIPPEQVIGRHLSDFFPPERVDEFMRLIQRVLETQQTCQVEYEIQADGQFPWFESSVSPMGQDATLWVARDITDRKHAEAWLRLQSAALEAAANAIIITDRNGIIQWANSSFTQLTGYEVSETIGKNSRELVRSGIQDEAFYRTLWTSILAGNTWQSELANRRKDGSIYIEEMTITPLSNNGGEISHFIAVQQDITSRKQADAALIQSEQAYRTLFQNVPIGLYRTTVDGRLLDVNPALVRMFGYPDLAALLACKVSDLYADPEDETKFHELIKGKTTLLGYEARFRRRDGSAFWGEDHAHLVSDDEGTPLYFEGSLIDVTERKHTAEVLRNASESLEAAHRELQKMFVYEQELARTDGLTGLYNRRYFFELATREFAASIRYHRPLTIILFDVDGFKQANDRLGHIMGDKILAQIAHTATSYKRDVDVLARYGGDEFIIMLPQTNLEQALLVAERIRVHAASIRDELPENPFPITISIGLSGMIYTPQDQSVEDIIRRADQALYQAKAQGNNRSVVFS